MRSALSARITRQAIASATSGDDDVDDALGIRHRAKGMPTRNGE
jgi:hypothetical protein